MRAVVLLIAALAAATALPREAGPRDEVVSLAAGGLTRAYRLHVPPGPAPRAGRPLVLLVHGHGSTAAGMERLSGFDAVADRKGAAAAYPEGIDRSWADGRGGTPADRRQIDDVQFLGAVIDDAVRRIGGDPSRVYVTGISNGGFMTARMACDQSSKIAAAAVVAATFGERLSARCRPLPTPIMFVDGEDDPLVPFGGGELTGGRGRVLSARGAAARWAHLNSCAPGTTTLTLPDRAHDGTTVVREDFTGCRDGADVRLVRIAGAGHTWPGGQQYLPVAMVGRTSHNLDANEALWEFFSAHRRSTRSPS